MNQFRQAIPARNPYCYSEKGEISFPNRFVDDIFGKTAPAPTGWRFRERRINRVAAARPMTLQDRVLQIDHIQARRFSKLADDAVEIAAEGIIRHLRACARMDVNPDASAVREIIDDALNGRRVFAETSNDLLAA